MTTTFTVDWQEKYLLMGAMKCYVDKLEENIEFYKEFKFPTTRVEKELKQAYELWEKIEKGEQAK